MPWKDMRILGSYALVYLLEGTGRFVDALGTDRALSPGDIWLLFPDVAHAYGAGRQQPWGEVHVVFDGPVFDLWRRQGLLDPANPIHRLEPIPFGLRMIERCLGPTSDELDVVERICQLQSFLAEVLTAGRAATMSEADRLWLEKARDLLQRPADDGPRVPEAVAGELGVSYAGFRKRFARLAGVPPARYRTRVAIDRACALLQGGLSLKQIAQRCGFCDEFHFSRRFKQVLGISPREFRRRLI